MVVPQDNSVPKEKKKTVFPDGASGQPTFPDSKAKTSLSPELETSSLQPVPAESAP